MELDGYRYGSENYLDQCIFSAISNLSSQSLPLPDTPSAPILSQETKTVSCNVNVTWSTPYNDGGCPLTIYSVYYLEMEAYLSGARWHEVNITDVLKTHYVLRLSCGTQYVIEMSAWNELGKSDRSKNWIVKTKSGKFLRFLN